MNKHTILPISGPQHPTVSNEMFESYKELYDAVKTNFGNEKLSRFFPMCGTRYNEELQVSKEVFETNVKFVSDEEFREKYMEPAVHLMIVGRSVNGWTELNEKVAEEFATAGANAILQNGFDWLGDDGKGIDTYIRESDKKECRYNINRSSFFRCTRKILNQLKPVTAVDKRWFEHIVWNNLYIIAPLHTGNAEGMLQDVQLEVGKKLLQQQIAYYKPTHILFITDWDWWFDRFADVFPGVVKIGDSARDNVVGKGVYNKAKVVVTVRPDRTRPNRPNEEQFVKDVVACFRE